MKNKVPVGVTSVVGWATAFLALLPTIIKAVEEGKVAFSGPEKYLAIFGIASGLVTNIARYLQAHKLIGMPIAEDIEKINSSDVKKIVDEVVSLVKNPIATLENVKEDEEIASDIDNIATGNPGPADGDNSKLNQTATSTQTVSVPAPSTVPQATLGG